jgi:hypothetical protein
MSTIKYLMEEDTVRESDLVEGTKVPNLQVDMQDIIQRVRVGTELGEDIDLN